MKFRVFILALAFLNVVPVHAVRPDQRNSKVGRRSRNCAAIIGNIANARPFVQDVARLTELARTEGVRDSDIAAIKTTIENIADQADSLLGIGDYFETTVKELVNIAKHEKFGDSVRIQALEVLGIMARAPFLSPEMNELIQTATKEIYFSEATNIPRNGPVSLQMVAEETARALPHFVSLDISQDPASLGKTWNKLVEALKDSKEEIFSDLADQIVEAIDGKFLNDPRTVSEWLEILEIYDSTVIGKDPQIALSNLRYHLSKTFERTLERSSRKFQILVENPHLIHEMRSGDVTPDLAILIQMASDPLYTRLITKRILGARGNEKLPPAFRRFLDNQIPWLIMHIENSIKDVPEADAAYLRSIVSNFKRFGLRASLDILIEDFASDLGSPFSGESLALKDLRIHLRKLVKDFRKSLDEETPVPAGSLLGIAEIKAIEGAWRESVDHSPSAKIAIFPSSVTQGIHSEDRQVQIRAQLAATLIWQKSVGRLLYNGGEATLGATDAQMKIHLVETMKALEEERNEQMDGYMKKILRIVFSDRITQETVEALRGLFIEELPFRPAYLRDKDGKPLKEILKARPDVLKILQEDFDLDSTNP